MTTQCLSYERECNNIRVTDNVMKLRVPIIAGKY